MENSNRKLIRLSDVRKLLLRVTLSHTYDNMNYSMEREFQR